MTTMTVSQLISEMAKLDENQQLALNKALCAMIRGNRKANMAAIGSSFSIGDVVKFTCTKRNNYGVKRIRIEKFNRARTAVVGYEVDTDGRKLTPVSVRWTVSTTLVSAA